MGNFDERQWGISASAVTEAAVTGEQVDLRTLNVRAAAW